MQGRPDKYKTIPEIDARISQLQSKKSFLEIEKQKFDMSIWHYNHRIEQLTERRAELVAETKRAAKKRPQPEAALPPQPIIKTQGQTTIEAFFKPRSQMRENEQSNPKLPKKR